MEYKGPTMMLRSRPALRAVMQAWLVSGTFDISSALVYYGIRYGIPPDLILKNIASGVFGEAAFRGGTPAIAAGLLFHYFIALVWAAVFFIAYPRIALLRKNVFTVAGVYGVIVWAAMNLVVVPLSRVETSPMHLEGALIAAAFLVLFIGVPDRIIIGRYFQNTSEAGKGFGGK